MAESSDTYLLIVGSAQEGPFSIAELRDKLCRGKARADDRVVSTSTKAFTLLSEVIVDAAELMRSAPSASDRIKRKNSDRHQAVAESIQRKTSERLLAVSESDAGPQANQRRPSEVLPAITEAVKDQRRTSEHSAHASEGRLRRTSEHTAHASEGRLRRTSEQLLAITEATKEVARNNPMTMAIATVVIILAGVTIWFELDSEPAPVKPFVGTTWVPLATEAKNPLHDLRLEFKDTGVAISTHGTTTTSKFTLEITNEASNCQFKLDPANPQLGATFSFIMNEAEQTVFVANGQKVILQRLVPEHPPTP